MTPQEAEKRRIDYLYWQAKRKPRKEQRERDAKKAGK